MRIPPILRRPGKLILCAVLLAVTSGAALLFALQAWLDGIALEHSMDAYAYVGTVTYEAPFTENGTITEDLQTSMDLAVLDERIVSLIQNSEYVTSYDTRSTLAGLVEDIHTVPDRMITTARLNQHYFIEATVIYMYNSIDLSELCYDHYTLRLEKQWGGDLLMKGGLNLSLWRSASEEPLLPGSRIFLVGCYAADGNGVRTDSTAAYTAGAAALSGEPYASSILMNNAVVTIPEGVDSESWIMAYMEKNGLLPLYENYCALENAVTVRQVSDLIMHPHFSSGRIFLESGRAIDPSDEGKKVCVISQGLSIRNRLNVGDTIRLAVADGCYTTSGLTPSANGWESGFPMESEELLTYGEFAQYEIVGIFSQISRKISDPLFLDQNDIFIPSDGESTGSVRSYNFSFRVDGIGYESFSEELNTVLNGEGYRLKFLDTGWDEVEDTFFLLQDRRKIMMFSAAAAFSLAAILFAVLTRRNCQYAYGLQRLLGGTRRESAREYIAAFCTAGFSGMFVAVLAALVGYLVWMRTAMEEVLTVALPTSAECVLMLAQVALAELMLSALILTVLGIIAERRGLLRLIRR